MSAAQRTEVVVSGGGVVGAALACALGERGVSTVLVAPARPALDWPADTVDLRVFAVSAASRRLFQALGAWPEMARLGVSPYRGMEVWDARGGGRIRFDAADVAAAELGHIVEQRVILHALWARLAQLPAVDILCPARLEDCAIEGDGVTVRLDGDRALRASLLVGADGGESRVRAVAGIGTDVKGYDQHAVVGVVATERHHQAVARQRFLDTGPLAFLPLADGRSSIVWSTAPEQAEALTAMTEDAFRAALGEAFDHALGEVTAAGPRAAFPLRRMTARHYVAERIALVGDAAHTIHPLAGQGVNLGLLDAAALAQVVLEQRARGRDWGRRHNLRPYERWRQGENRLMALAMGGFKGLFGVAWSPVARLRSLGLTAVERSTPLKRVFMTRAMGLGGELPALMAHPGDYEEMGEKPG